MYIPKHFQAFELVPKEIFDTHTQQQIFSFFDENLLRDLDTIRTLCNIEYGDCFITINDWKTGGKFSQRGLRTNRGVGSLRSAHFDGDAFDFDVYKKTGITTTRIDPKRVRELLNKKRRELIGVRRIENGVNWVHIDSRIHFFNP